MLLFRLLRRTPSPNLLPKPPAAAFSTTSAATVAVADPSLTIYFLSKSCGLSPAAATAAAGKIHLKNTRNSHSVVTLLKSYGFSLPHITRLISGRPKLLLADASKTLKPKFDFLLSIGISDLPSFLSPRPGLLLWSLPRRMIPNHALLKSLLGSDDHIATAIKKSPALLTSDLRKVFLPKIEVLKSHDVPIPVILRLITLHPGCLLEPADWFEATIGRIKAMGIRVESLVFGHAMGVLRRLPEGEWEKKLGAYLGLGWKEEEVMAAFVKHPYVLSVSEEKIKQQVEFLEKKVGWERAYLVKNPVAISLSLERRIRRRCAVVEVLGRKVAAMEGRRVTARDLMMGEEQFVEKYVRKYEEMVPEVVEAMEGRLEFQGFLGREEDGQEN